MAERIGDFVWALRLLRPGGALAMHIMTGQPRHSADCIDTYDTYTFPGGEPSPLGLTLHAAEKAGFEVRTVESLREDFRLTLHRWAQRLEARHDQALRLVGEATYRAWRLFVADLTHAFSAGSVGAYQVLLVKPERIGWRQAASASPAEARATSNVHS